jgi:hypothetical protein
MNITPKELVELIKKNNLMKYGGGVVTYKNKYNKKYGYDKDESHDLKEIAKDTDVSVKGLQQIYNKGVGAYKTNPQSVRPNVKSKEQWAMARVYSAVMGGKAARVDAKELKMETGGLVEDNKTLMRDEFVAEQRELHKKSKYAVFLDARGNYTDEMREVYNNLEDDITKKLGYNPLFDYSPVGDKNDEILMFDNDSNLLGVLFFTIKSQYTIVERFSHPNIKSKPISGTFISNAPPSPSSWFIITSLTKLIISSSVIPSLKVDPVPNLLCSLI